LPGTRLPALPWRRPRLRRPQIQDVLDTLATDGEAVATTVEATPHLIVLRFEYANVFHAMTDWYNVFLAQRFLGLPASRVVLADGHPATPLDDGWRTLFGEVRRIATFPRAACRFDTLVLTTLGWDSPLLDFDAWTLPLVEDFRRFVLAAHGVDADAPRPGGSRRVTLVLREDYRAHAHGGVSAAERKFANAEAMIRALAAMPGVSVRAVAMEALTVGEQVTLASNTDVLVGMHGAGLVHALFLPPWAGIVELYPAYCSTRRRHFRRLAAWRGLAYRRWRNRDPAREHPDHRTEIPPAVLVEEVRRVIGRADA
jgi:glycoprotein 2-beta-D-xylosyltransferase